MSEMTRTEELLALAKEATPGPWRADGEHGYIDCVCTKTFCIASDIEKEDAAFIAAANPETIKQLVELCRLQHEALMLLDYGTRFDEATGAIAAFNHFDQGGE